MPTIIHTPRINNNDDVVRLAAVLVEVGARVRAGEAVIDVETDKANFTVEAPVDGFFLGATGNPGDAMQVGSVLAWIGASAEERIPDSKGAAADGQAGGEPTLKALLLLKAHGLTSGDVPHSGRLTVADVERHVARRAPVPGAAAISSWPAPEEPGRVEPFTPERRAMARTVTWHRDVAAAGYIELAYDPAPWDAYAAEFQKSRSLLLNPLLALMAWRLAKLAAPPALINATAEGEGVWFYEQVNLACTVQAGQNLYLVVIRDAAAKTEEEFAAELGKLQRAATKHTLKSEHITGATIGFTSMARWKVSRHIPILAPHTSLMVAHSSPGGGAACLGASYDHRVLTGFDVVQVLQKLSVPID